ncbi:SapC family protein [Altererythrobacter aquiaggeris]|uniref:SapC family protein n=1 Tax=Aestuarierythrobacter aquiaggeris TaxID=1898396 RepID=UPI0030170071
MASAPPSNLPLMYNDLMPLNSRDHSTWKARTSETAPWLVGQHAIPLTTDEFIQAQRNFPIVFASGDAPTPLALMGLNEGVNTYIDADGKVSDPVYIPAYVRRYPFLLAKLQKDSEEMSLCFDPTSDVIGEFDEGVLLFDEEQKPTPRTNDLLKFCQQFEEAGQRTRAFVEELQKHDLLMEGEVAISTKPEDDKPYVYRGFQMVNQEKLREVRGDVLRTWNQNGLITLIYAHLFSMNLMRDIFARQVDQGSAPKITDAS